MPTQTHLQKLLVHLHTPDAQLPALERDPAVQVVPLIPLVVFLLFLKPILAFPSVASGPRGAHIPVQGGQNHMQPLRQRLGGFSPLPRLGCSAAAATGVGSGWGPMRPGWHSPCKGRELCGLQLLLGALQDERSTQVLALESAHAPFESGRCVPVSAGQQGSYNGCKRWAAATCS